MTWHITIPGEPKGRATPAAFGYTGADGKPKARQVQTKTTKSFEAMVAAFAAEALRDVPRLDCPLVVDVLGVFSRPGHLDEPWQPDGLIVHATKPDRDNLEKAVQDGLKAQWRDDCRVSVGTTVKAYAERGGKPRTEVWIRALAPVEVVELHGNRVAMPAHDGERDEYRADVKAKKAAERERIAAEKKAEKARLRDEKKAARRGLVSP